VKTTKLTEKRLRAVISDVPQLPCIVKDETALQVDCDNVNVSLVSLL